MRLDPTNCEVLVFVFKQSSLLSSAAHDLKLRVARFKIEISDESITGEFEAGSLEPVCAMKDEREVPTPLSGSARAEIGKNTREKVLAVNRYPTIRFESLAADGSAEARGRLTLCGVTRELRGKQYEQGELTVAEFRLMQSDFGIRPFSAWLGALKVRDEVLVRVSFTKTLAS